MSRFVLIAKVEKSNDVINDVMSCHAWITCQWRERTDLKECIIKTAGINLTFIHHNEVCLLLNQNKNIKLYSIQKTYKTEWYDKVTLYVNSTSFFTAYNTKFVNRKLFRQTEDIIKTVMKPFRVALTSLLFDVIIFINYQLRYHQLTTWQSALLVLFTV